MIGGFFVFVAVSGAVFVAVAERGLPSALRDWLLPGAKSGREVTSMFPGVVSHDFHQKEALYNQYLQRVERQRQRGWQIEKGWLTDPKASEPAVLRVVARTREGEPITGAAVEGEFLRPSSSQRDVAFTSTETGPGVYESKLLLPLAGNWDLVLQIRKGEDLHEIRAVTRVLDR